MICFLWIGGEPMKLKIEYLSPEDEEEIVIKCHFRSEKIQLIEHTLEKILSSQAEIAVSIGPRSSSRKFSKTRRIKFHTRKLGKPIR